MGKFRIRENLEAVNPEGATEQAVKGFDLRPEFKSYLLPFMWDVAHQLLL